MDVGWRSSNVVEYLEKRVKGDLGELMDGNELNSREIELLDYIAQERESGAKTRRFHRGDQLDLTYEHVGTRGMADARLTAGLTRAQPRNIVWVSKSRSKLCGYGLQGKHYHNEVLRNAKW